MKTIANKFNLDTATMTATLMEKVGDDWQELTGFDWNNIPKEIQNELSLYGLRAALADRTSDAKKLGVNKAEWMTTVFEQFVAGDWKKTVVRAPAVDRALVHLIVELKKCNAIQAEAALKAAGKDFATALKTKYADRIAAINAELNEPAIDLLDL